MARKAKEREAMARKEYEELLKEKNEIF